MKKIQTVLNVIILVLLGLSLLCIKNTQSTYTKYMSDTNGVNLAIYDATSFMEASDYLTDQARMYVATQDGEYLTNYFTEVNETRRRELAISRLLEADKSQTKIYAYLQKSFGLSNELTKPEIHAMALIASATHMIPSEMPKQIREYKLTETEQSYSLETAKNLAHELVFGQEYLEKKSEITTKISACSNLLDTELLELKNKSNADMDKRFAHMYIYSALIILLVLISLLITILRIREAKTSEEKIKEPESKKKFKKDKKDKSKGFTMAELVIVLLILAAITAVLVPSYLRYVSKSRFEKATGNATEFKKITEMTMVDALMGDADDAETTLSYQAISTEFDAPEDSAGSEMIKKIYDGLSLGNERYEVIALIRDYKVTQVTYHDLRNQKIYVWFGGHPEGTMLQTTLYQGQSGEWLVFDALDDQSWIGMYSKWDGNEICWNGYDYPEAHRKQ